MGKNGEYPYKYFNEMLAYVHGGNMRLFIAIDIDDKEIKYKTSIIQNMLVNSGVRGTHPTVDQLHITLKFLGETPDFKIKLINDVLGKIKVDEKIVLNINGVGAFPSLKKPRIIFLDVKANDVLYVLQSQIERGMVKLGFKKEDRPFKPHITIFRIKKPWSWKSYLEKELVSVHIDKTLYINEFKLKESLLTPSGPIYKDLNVYKLGD